MAWGRLKRLDSTSVSKDCHYRKGLWQLARLCVNGLSWVVEYILHIGISDVLSQCIVRRCISVRCSVLLHVVRS